MNGDSERTQAIEVVETKAPTQIQRAPTAMGPRGLLLTNLDEAFRFSKAVVASGMAPKGMNEAGVLIAIEMGAELGLPPMASLQSVAVINGRPSVWGDAIPAVCMASGAFDHAAYDEQIEYDAATGFPTAATCTVRRLPHGKLKTRRFAIDDAKRAKLFGKAGPWSEYPARMLQMRARSWAMRDAFPDLLRGFPVADRESGEMVDGPPPTKVEQIDAPVAKPTSLGALTERMAARVEPAPMPMPPPTTDDDRGPLTQEEVDARNASAPSEPATTGEPVYVLEGEETPEREPGSDPDEPPPEESRRARGKR